MPPLSLEQRVAALEHEVAEMKSLRSKTRQKDWRRTIGMFTDNPEMQELFAEGMKIRALDRKKAHQLRGRTRSVKS